MSAPTRAMRAVPPGPWIAGAVCAGLPQWTDDDPLVRQAAAAVCRTACPVLAECRDWAVHSWWQGVAVAGWVAPQDSPRRPPMPQVSGVGAVSGPLRPVTGVGKVSGPLRRVTGLRPVTGVGTIGPPAPIDPAGSPPADPQLAARQGAHFGMKENTTMALLSRKSMQLPDPPETRGVERVTVPASTRNRDGHWNHTTTAEVQLDLTVPESLRAVYDQQDSSLGYWDVRCEVVIFSMREKDTNPLTPIERVMIPDNFPFPTSMANAACFDEDGHYLPGGNPAGVAYRVHPADLPIRWHRHQLVLSRAQRAAYAGHHYDTAAAQRKAREDSVIASAAAGDFKPDFRERQLASWILGLAERGERP